MFYWIWFFALTTLGYFFAYRVWHEKGSDPGQDHLLSYSAMLMGVVLSWDVVGVNVYNWMHDFLPYQGTAIHNVTLLFMCGILVVFWFAHPVFLGLVRDLFKKE